MQLLPTLPTKLKSHQSWHCFLLCSNRSVYKQSVPFIENIYSHPRFSISWAKQVYTRLHSKSRKRKRGARRRGTVSASQKLHHLQREESLVQMLLCPLHNLSLLMLLGWACHLLFQALGQCSKTHSGFRSMPFSKKQGRLSRVTVWRTSV